MTIHLRNRVLFLNVLPLVAALCLPAAGGQAAERLVKPVPDAVSVPQLMKNLDSDDLRVSSAAARSLGVIFAPGGKGGEELPAVTKMLIERLDSPKGADLRRECATALGRMHAATAADGLKKAMADRDIFVAMAAGEALGEILPVDEARAFLTKGTAEESESARLAGYHGLAAICKAEDAPVLLKGLAAANWRTQMAAVKGLERAVRGGARLQAADYDAVAAVLGSEIRNAADAAMHFFLGVQNPESLRGVLKAAETPDEGNPNAWRARMEALRTVRHLGPATARDALPVVVRQLGDRTANVTNEAKAILEWLRTERFVRHGDLQAVFVAELEQAGPLPLRAGIMEEMGDNIDHLYMSRVAKIAADTLAKSLDDKPQWSARAHAINLLSATGHIGSMEQIATCVGDNATNVRQAAGHALETLAPLCSAKEQDVVAPVLLPLLTKTEDWRKTAIAARSVGPYAKLETIAPLVQLLSHGVLNVREGAAHALVVVTTGENQDLRAEVEKLVYPELEKNERAWETGTDVLGALKQAKAVPILTTILQRGQWRAQASAAKAIAQIAAVNKINDKPLSDSLIRAAQSDVLQVQEAANQALRVLNQGAAEK